MAASLLRAYADVANEMSEAGYNDGEIAKIKADVDHFEKVRNEVKLASGDYIDLKMYEPAMRHLIDTYPPHGRIRLAAPPSVSDEAVRLAIVTRMAWIRRQRAKFVAQPRQSARAYISGESHYFLGQRYRLRLIEGAPVARVRIRNSRSLELHVRGSDDESERERVFLAWYRKEIRNRSAPIVKKWAATMDLAEPRFGIRRMKTKWGSYSIQARRIWLNLELIKKPVQCIEYVVAHELTHLLERNHTDRFVALMNRHLPQWRLIRDELNSEPLAHENWSRFSD